MRDIFGFRNQAIKRDVFLLILIFLMSLTISLFAYFSPQSLIKPPRIPVVYDEVKNFTKDNPSLGLLQTESFGELLNPQFLMVQATQHDRKDLLQLETLRQSCKSTLSPFQDVSVEKARILFSSLCSHKTLPLDFWKRAPLMSPLGASYAWLAVQYYQAHTEESKISTPWPLPPLEAFHVFELKEVQRLFPVKIDDLLKVSLIELTWEQLFQVSESDPIVLNEKFVFIRSSESPLQYRLYAREGWDKFWKATDLHPSQLSKMRSPEKCFLRASDVCWVFDVSQSLLGHWNPLTLILALLILALLILIYQVARALQQRAIEQDRLRFSLEMLTHELRTPMANLNIYAEKLREQFDDYGPRGQTTCLQVLEQIARIHRITQASQNYLSKSSRPEFITPRWVVRADLFAFLKDCLIPFEGQMDSFEQENPLGATEVWMDPYWTLTCLNNIIQNAINHGQVPIKLKLCWENQFWVFEVEDAGTMPFDPLKKASTSSGMGLGLKLLHRILPLLCGEISFTFTPTRVTLRFQIDPRTNNTQLPLREKNHEPIATS